MAERNLDTLTARCSGIGRLPSKATLVTLNSPITYGTVAVWTSSVVQRPFDVVQLALVSGAPVCFSKTYNRFLVALDF